MGNVGLLHAFFLLFQDIADAKNANDYLSGFLSDGADSLQDISACAAFAWEEQGGVVHELHIEPLVLAEYILLQSIKWEIIV